MGFFKVGDVHRITTVEIQKNNKTASVEEARRIAHKLASLDPNDLEFKCLSKQLLESIEKVSK